MIRCGSTATTWATRAPSFHGGQDRLHRTSMAGHPARVGFTEVAAQGLTRHGTRSAWDGPGGAPGHPTRRGVTPVSRRPYESWPGWVCVPGARPGRSTRYSKRVSTSATPSGESVTEPSSAYSIHTLSSKAVNTRL